MAQNKASDLVNHGVQDLHKQIQQSPAMSTWLKETSKQSPWSVYSRSNTTDVTTSIARLSNKIKGSRDMTPKGKGEQK